MKLAVTGKGGVGKTTFSALLSRALLDAGYQVTAIDADPDANLAACMGHPQAEALRPLVELKELIEERTGVKPGTTGGMFRLNPFVEDIPERYAETINGVRVLVAGAVKRGGAGCYCPENAMVRALISHLLLEPEVALVLDMEAGIEHLSRGTVRNVDQLAVVVEPTRRSSETAQRIERLALDVGLRHIGLVINKVRSAQDRELVESLLPSIPVLGCIPFDDALRQAEVAGRPPTGASAAVDAAVKEIVEGLAMASQS